MQDTIRCKLLEFSDILYGMHVSVRLHFSAGKALQIWLELNWGKSKPMPYPNVINYKLLHCLRVEIDATAVSKL